MKKTRGPAFLRFVIPILDTLKELGASGTAGEVAERVIERCKISNKEQDETTSNGQSRVRNQIAWARFYLVKADLVDASQRGVWSLTPKGRSAKLDEDGVLSLFKRVQAQFKSAGEEDEPSAEGEPAEPKPLDYRAELLAMLRSLPPSGFERVCQRLLRESGFQQVHVTGRSGDGGIDGHGVLEINPLVTFKVLFQCKRYNGRAVTPDQVRDFRGAMAGRADKGLILTTTTFTTDARKEATRDGVPPIELVDWEKLVAMFERAGLGLRPVKTYEINPDFFEEFKA
ncbi:MAG: restriction endonuclease [Polyangiales bacterium]